MYRPKVYTASKIRHAPLWRAYRSSFHETIEFTSRWINHDGPDHDTTHWNPEQKTLHWIEDIQDVQRSDYLIAYTEAEDANKGTLVEVGVALGLGKIVLIHGFDDKHSWQSHPLVMSFTYRNGPFDYILGRKLRNA